MTVNKTKCEAKIKPILFCSDMVRAILDGCKTETRRVVKHQDAFDNCVKTFEWNEEDAVFDAYCENDTDRWIYAVPPPYRPGDILYVRETYSPKYYDKEIANYWNGGNRIVYKADWDALSQDAKDLCAKPIWHPSIHMPREAARIFLRVTDVRVERLQEISDTDIEREGLHGDPYTFADPEFYDRPELKDNYNKAQFAGLWDSTIKPADREKYGWAANPFCWVIEFERCEKPT